MGKTQVLKVAMTEPSEPSGRRPMASCFFSLFNGFFRLLARVVAGVVWDRVDAASTFLGGCARCGMAFVASIGLKILDSQRVISASDG